MLVECKQTHTKKNISLISVFTNGDNELVYKIAVLNADIDNKYQKDEAGVIEYELSGITHNVMCNMDRQVVAWMNENVECALSMDCTEEVLYKIIQSIYFAEGYR